MSVDVHAFPGPRSLPWETDFLGVNVGTLQAGPAVTADTLQAVLRSDEARAFDLLVVAHVGDSARLRPILEDAGARLVDTKLDYRAPVEAPAPVAQEIERIAEAANAADRAALEALALESGRFSRFRLDPRIGEARWEELYRLWIRNSLAGRMADAVFVWRRDDAITGFVTVKREASNRARIGLIGVDAAERGAGVGTELVAAARRWAAGEKLNDLWVATQRANRAACLFYTSRGFTLTSETDIYHLWTRR
ncbi:MAG TPA: GNAT family N-acetyltransferase [Allosphingosinicella sp.]